MIFFVFFKNLGSWVFLVHPNVVSVLLSASVERCFVSRMRFFFFFHLADLPILLFFCCLQAKSPTFLLLLYLSKPPYFPVVFSLTNYPTFLLLMSFIKPLTFMLLFPVFIVPGQTSYSPAVIRPLANPLLLCFFYSPLANSLLSCYQSPPENPILSFYF